MTQYNIKPMSLSQTYPSNYPSLLYPSSGSQFQQTILPRELPHGTGGNAADYMSKAVGGSRRKRRTIIRNKKRAGKKSRKNIRRKKSSKTSKK
jgi:hypothetical protein